MIRSSKINTKNVFLFITAIAILLVVWVMDVLSNIFLKTGELSTHSSKKSTSEEIAVEDIAAHAINNVNESIPLPPGKSFWVRGFEPTRENGNFRLPTIEQKAPI